MEAIYRSCGTLAAALLLLLPTAMLILALYGLVALFVPSVSCAGTYLGRLGSNPYCSDCTANEFAPINNPYRAKSLTNPYGRYGNPYSPYSANNPYATKTPRIYGE